MAPLGLVQAEGDLTGIAGEGMGLGERWFLLLWRDRWRKDRRHGVDRGMQNSLDGGVGGVR